MGKDYRIMKCPHCQNQLQRTSSKQSYDSPDPLMVECSTCGYTDEIIIFEDAEVLSQQVSSLMGMLQTRHNREVANQKYIGIRYGN